jgi:hypothetical protein
MTNHWKKITGAERAYTDHCIAQLKSCPWVHDLINKTEKTRDSNGDFPNSSMPLLFEIRFAYALYKVGLSTQNGYKCGTKNSEIKDSDVDFFVTKTDGTKWFIELTSLDESDEVKTNTSVEGAWSLYTGKGVDDPYKIYRRAQSNIFSKVAKNEDNVMPTKFLPPEKGEHNIIIIDMRGLMVATPDNYDYSIVINGENDIPIEGVPFLRGIFNPNHPNSRAKYLQERIHGIGFIVVNK